MGRPWQRWLRIFILPSPQEKKTTTAQSPTISSTSTIPTRAAMLLGEEGSAMVSMLMARYSSRRTIGKRQVCVFCRNNGECERFYTSHYVPEGCGRQSHLPCVHLSAVWRKWGQSPYDQVLPAVSVITLSVGLYIASAIYILMHTKHAGYHFSPTFVYTGCMDSALQYSLTIVFLSLINTFCA